MLPLLAEIWTDAPALDERSAPRRTLWLEVPAYSSRRANEALIHNLSEKGLLLETSGELAVGEAFQVDLPHAGANSAIRGQFAGCEFLSPVTKAAVSAALLLAPVQLIEHPRAPKTFRSAPDFDAVSYEEREAPASQTVVLISLILSLLLRLRSSLHFSAFHSQIEAQCSGH